MVSRDSVRIAFLYAALNDLDILSADVQNAYLNAPMKEKLYTTTGLEFEPTNVGRPVLIVCVLPIWPLKFGHQMARAHGFYLT
jgi:hypothetical protein